MEVSTVHYHLGETGQAAVHGMKQTSIELSQVGYQVFVGIKEL